MTNKELLEDLLIEFDELDMQPMTIVPDPLDRAKAWKHELTYAIKHLKAEVAREIFAEIENYMLDFEDITHTVNRTIGAATFALLKKKYTEGETQKSCEHCQFYDEHSKDQPCCSCIDHSNFEAEGENNG